LPGWYNVEAMYRRILVAVEHSSADRTILDHVMALARLTGAELLLVHVADGFAARHFNDLKLRESEEMRSDAEYLARLQTELQASGLKVEVELAKGDPARELIKLAETRDVDLLAMSTHGHRFVKDVLLGATADRVRHLVSIPVLLLRAQ
jgi:nucleotide-binding universal stress UspA family protein